MLNIYDRNFQNIEKIPEEIKSNININKLSPENAVAFDLQEQERIRAQKVEEFLNKKINNEIERATQEENKINKIIHYNFQEVTFGGTCDANSWIDSITIYKNTEEQ